VPARDTVPVGPIREAMLATGLPKRTLARKLGLPKRTVARLMGAPDYRISPVTGRRLGPYVQENVMYDRAVIICDKLPIDYTEVGV